jgi:hypothetical protein
MLVLFVAAEKHCQLKQAIDIREYIDCSLREPHALFWLSSYVASHYLAMVPQSSAKCQFYSTVYYIALNSNCEAQRVSKNLKNIAQDRVKGQY